MTIDELKEEISKINAYKKEELEQKNIYDEKVLERVKINNNCITAIQDLKIEIDRLRKRKGQIFKVSEIIYHIFFCLVILIELIIGGAFVFIPAIVAISLALFTKIYVQSRSLYNITVKTKELELLEEEKDKAYEEIFKYKTLSKSSAAKIDILCEELRTLQAEYLNIIENESETKEQAKELNLKLD